MLAYSRWGVAAERTLPGSSNKLGWVGDAIVVESWPLYIHAPHLCRRGKRGILRLGDLKQCCQQHESYAELKLIVAVPDKLARLSPHFYQESKCLE